MALLWARCVWHENGEYEHLSVLCDVVKIAIQNFENRALYLFRLHNASGSVVFIGVRGALGKHSAAVLGIAGEEWTMV